MLRKNTTQFVKLQNNKYGLRSWYPNLKAPKEASTSKVVEDNKAKKRRYRNHDGEEVSRRIH